MNPVKTRKLELAISQVSLNRFLRYGKTGKNLQHCCRKGVEKRCCVFYYPRSKLSCNNSSCCDCCRFRKFVSESSEWFYFFRQNLYMLRVLLAQGKLVLQQVSCMAWHPRNFIKSELRSQYSRNLQKPDLWQDRFDSWVIKLAKQSCASSLLPVLP